LNSLYCFLATEGLTFLKRGYFPFSSPAQMPEPWLQPDCHYLAQESFEVSAQEYRLFLQQQYQGLPKSLKDMMTFDYFEQQSEAKRAQIEQSLIAQKQHSDVVKPFATERLQDWRILSMFKHWQNIQLWQSMSASGKGLVIEFDLNTSGFQTQDYNQQAQHLAAVNQVGSWLPEDDLYYFFNRPQDGSLHHHEWRLVRKLDAADRHIEVKGVMRSLYRLPSKAVKRVILGYRCPPEYCQQVKQYLSQDINYRHAECVQAQLNPKTLCLQLVRIKH
jgi:hypothetical protein